MVRIQDDPPRFETILERGAAFTSSYEEEKAALGLAISWISDNCDPSSRPLIVTDSQSLYKALMGYDPSVSSIKLQLEQCGATVGIQWVPGHCGIEGNELADRAANEARTYPSPNRFTSYQGIVPAIKKSIQDPPCRPKYATIAEAYSKYSKTKEKQLLSEWDAVYMTRLRAGHHWDLHSYLHRITVNAPATTIDPTCQRCKEEVEDTPNLFQCPGTMALRQELFGSVEVPLSALTDHPQQSLALARRALRGAGRRNSATH